MPASALKLLYPDWLTPDPGFLGVPDRVWLVIINRVKLPVEDAISDVEDAVEAACRR